MLVRLLNVPRSSFDWNEWSFAHMQSHIAIASAVKAQKGALLTEYQLDPIPQNDRLGFLERNQQAHTEMNEAVGLQSSDLQDTDFDDERQLESWIYLHFLEHQTIEQTLGIG